MGGGATGGGGGVVVGEGSWDGGGKVLEKLLPELETLWGERGGCFCHDLHTTGVSWVWLCVVADDDTWGRAEVPELIGCVKNGMWTAVAVKLVLNQIAVQFGME